MLRPTGKQNGLNDDYLYILTNGMVGVTLQFDYFLLDGSGVGVGEEFVNIPLIKTCHFNIRLGWGM